MMLLKVFGQECNINFLEKVRHHEAVCIPIALAKQMLLFKSWNTIALRGIDMLVSAPQLLVFECSDHSIGNKILRIGNSKS